MILLDSAFEAAGLTVLRDHVAPHLFHYLPGVPTPVAGPGQAGLQLVRFRGQRQGGFLNVDVDLRLPAEPLAAAREELRRRSGGEAELVPVLFRAGSVRLVLLGTETAGATPTEPAESFLVERVLAVGTPSLLGAGRAVFVAQLSAEGASLVAQAFEARDAPAVILYDLEYEGLRPARGLRASVDVKQAYSFLRSRLAAGALAFRGDVAFEAEALAREGFIRIEDVDYTGADPRLRAERQVQVQATLRELSETLFFRPAATPAALGTPAGPAGAALDAAWARSGRPQAAFVLRALEQAEQQTLHYDLREMRLARARIAPQGALHAAGAAPLTLDVDGDWPPLLAVVDVAAVPDADWSGVAAVTVDLRRGTELRSVALQPEVPPQALAFSGIGPVEYRLRALVQPEPGSLGTPAPADTAFRALDARHLFVDPALVAGRRCVRIELGGIDSALIPKVRGRASAGSSGGLEFVLDAAHPGLTVPVWGGEPCRVAAQLVTADGATLDVEREAAPGQDLVVLSPPAAMLLNVTVVLQDPLARYEAVFVELEGPSGEQRRAVRLSGATSVACWSLPRAAEAPRTFRYRLRSVGKDARVEDHDWREGAGALLVVGDVDLRLQDVEVVLAGAGTALGALVRLTSLAPPPGVDPTFEALLDPEQKSLSARLPFRREAATRYVVAAQVFTEEGQRDIGPFESADEVLILQV